MLSILLVLLVLALVLALVYWIASMFLSGTPLKIVGAILGLIFVITALHRLAPSLGVSL